MKRSRDAWTVSAPPGRRPPKSGEGPSGEGPSISPDPKAGIGKSIPAEDLPVIARSARAALAVPIAAKGLPTGTRLLKAYATSPRRAKRVVYLLVIDGGDLFLLFYRGKDDPLGRNVSLSNPEFRKALDTHLNLLEEEIARGDIEPVMLP